MRNQKICKVYKDDKVIFEGNLTEIAKFLDVTKSAISKAVIDERPTKNGYHIVITNKSGEIKKQENEYGAEIERRLKIYGNTCFQNHKDEILKHLDSKGINYKIELYKFPKEKGFCENKDKKLKSSNWYIELI